jgi:hypothetical protein
MEAEKSLTLEEFAEQVRQECVTIISRCAFGHTKEAGALAAALCERAARIVRDKQMREEAGADYDLGALKGLPMNAPETEAE